MTSRVPSRAWSTSTLQAGLSLVNTNSAMYNFAGMSDAELQHELQASRFTLSYPPNYCTHPRIPTDNLYLNVHQNNHPRFWNKRRLRSKKLPSHNPESSLKSSSPASSSRRLQLMPARKEWPRHSLSNPQAGTLALHKPQWQRQALAPKAPAKLCCNTTSRPARPRKTPRPRKPPHPRKALRHPPKPPHPGARERPRSPSRMRSWIYLFRIKTTGTPRSRP